MERDVKKRVSCNGVEIQVVQKKMDFIVEIVIGTELDLTCKQKFVCDDFKFCFIPLKEGVSFDKPLCLPKKGRKYNKRDGMNYYRMKHSTDEYYCDISIAPHLYVPEIMQEKSKCNHEQRMRKKAKIAQKK